jgi:hypothetical protein
LTYTAAVKTILCTAPLSAALQVVPQDPSWAAQIERVGLLSALLVAVLVLWRETQRREQIHIELVKEKDEQIADLTKEKDDKIADKDKQLMEASRHMVEALITQSEANREMRRVMESLLTTIEKLRADIGTFTVRDRARALRHEGGGD